MPTVENAVEQMEDRINEFLATMDRYEGEMRQELATRSERDPVAKLAGFQVTRIGWLRDLGDQMEEIIRDMLDRVQNVDLANSGHFTGRPDDVSGGTHP